MKKILFSSILFFSFLSVLPGICKAQSSKLAGAVCSCGAGQSTCSSSCTFSDCCVCWSTASQNGGCGCYWGVASCKTAKLEAKSFAIDPNTFGEVNPDAHIKFSFENFKKVYSFFKDRGISTSTLESSVGDVSARYVMSKEKVDIANADAGKIFKNYSDLISKLDARQKDDLNAFIKSL